MLALGNIFVFFRFFLTWLAIATSQDNWRGENRQTLNNPTLSAPCNCTACFQAKPVGEIGATPVYATEPVCSRGPTASPRKE
ncbi:hypothetical protein LCGC14_1503320 [marine sediment metagenome]|uniref:Uncharacterized protein n=1 Tax=marine sediment metagenome TaxID=412755 RepID=A0A0F9M4U9_9ZZZZ